MEESSQLPPLDVDTSPLADALVEVHEVYLALQEAGFDSPASLQIVSHMVGDLVGSRGMLVAYTVEDEDDEDEDDDDEGPIAG